MSNRNGVWSLPAQYQAIADQDWTMAPGAPTGVSATAGNAQAEVSFTAPTFAGIPGTITQFKVTSSSGQTATGSASPITVTGLTNGSGVTFTAQAQNAIGLGKASDASSSVTPLAQVISSLFSTHVYTGNNSNITITNGINLSGKGGLVWIKKRDANEDHGLVDTVRGGGKVLRSNATTAVQDKTGDWTSFNSNGFSLGGGEGLWSGANDYVSWTFRKEPKFFDIQTYTGDGTNGRSVSHNLGTTVGMIILKRTDASGDDWQVFHRYAINKRLELNNTDAAAATTLWNDGGTGSGPTSTNFTVDNASFSNENGATYVAYLFAHNDGDGGFGPDSEDIIKCGSYTGTGSSGHFINLGFEPQWLLIKNADASESWIIQDNMRSMTDTDYAWLYADGNNDEAGGSLSGGASAARPTGFEINLTGANINASGNTYIYVAIRRPDQSTPTTGTDVFAVQDGRGSDKLFTAGFPVDMLLVGDDTGDDWQLRDRIRGGVELHTNNTDAEGTNTFYHFDDQTGIVTSSGGGSAIAQLTGYMWKRAKGYFDTVAYSGTGSARTVTHNLGAVPEMMWIKRRDATGFWSVYHKDVNGGSSPEDYYLVLHDTNTATDDATIFNDTAPTSSVFSVGTHNRVNNSSGTYIAHLFATVAGVSKVGTCSHTFGGGNTDVDCGFSNGCRFLLIKSTTHTYNWEVYDTARGITTGNDPYLTLNTTNAEVTNNNGINPLSSGFTLMSTGWNTGTYIFYAIA